MHPKLAQLQDVLSEAILGITAEELARHPEGKWCSTEILDHLNLTYTGTIKNLERCLTAGHPGAKSDRSKRRLARFAITRLGYFPGGRRSPDRVLPRGTPAAQLLSELPQNIVRMDEIISRCEANFGRTVFIAEHPVLGPLTANEWRGFHLAHGKHHAKQIIRLRTAQTS